MARTRAKYKVSDGAKVFSKTRTEVLRIMQIREAEVFGSMGFSNTNMNISNSGWDKVRGKGLQKTQFSGTWYSIRSVPVKVLSDHLLLLVLFKKMILKR